VLYAPDIVHSATTVIDLVSRRVRDRIQGVTTPRFGRSPDRYVVVVPGEVLVVSYPERAVIARHGVPIESPWQTAVVSNTALLVLERRPDGASPAYLTAVDLVSGQLVYRRRLPGSVSGMALSAELGLIALADADVSMVRLLEPETLRPVLELDVVGVARDLGFLAGGTELVAATFDRETEHGGLRSWRLKQRRAGIKIQHEATIEVDGEPIRLATAPMDLPRVALGLSSARVVVIDLGGLEVIHAVQLSSALRDLVWCDPTAPGPLLPQWSDRSPPELTFDPS
jgi:hypothetical protein